MRGVRSSSLAMMSGNNKDLLIKKLNCEVLPTCMRIALITSFLRSRIMVAHNLIIAHNFIEQMHLVIFQSNNAIPVKLHLDCETKRIQDVINRLSNEPNSNV
jgi:hypothetical protein